MRPHHKTLLWGIMGILALDAAGSFLFHIFKFNYSYLAIISLFIYGTVGFETRKTTYLKTAIQFSAIVGLVDATVGWAICIWLNANLGDFVGTPTPGMRVFTIISIMSLAAIFGRIGAALVESRRKSTTAQKIS